jgi:uncharacterized membrane protein (TIGR02234 family)
MTSAVDARRELGSAIAGCIVGATAVLLAGEAAWGRVQLVVGESLPVVQVELSGREAAPLAVALGLLALAAAAALVATRGVLRRVVGGLVLVVGVAIVVDALAASGRFAVLAVDTSPGSTAEVTSATGWSWLAVAGGILLVGAGLGTVLRGGRWHAMSQRYEAPGAGLSHARRPVGDPTDPDAAWRALDRGEDPTTSG